MSVPGTGTNFIPSEFTNGASFVAPEGTVATLEGLDLAGAAIGSDLAGGTLERSDSVGLAN
jgi:hypothetical protein